MVLMILFFLSLLLGCPMMALGLHLVLASRPLVSAQYAGYLMGVAFLAAVGLLGYLSWLGKSVLCFWVNIDTLNALLGSLVLFISFAVHRFSYRYMQGDRLYRRFFILMSSLTLSLLLMVLADHLALLWVSWFLSNGLLVMLMVHKKEWRAAKNAGMLAFYTLAFGSLALLMAFVLFYLSSLTDSLQTLMQQAPSPDLPLTQVAMSFLLVAVLIQSALFPFHRWLLSSLNSPTPVSAFMHAGLINGGGILMVKFAPMMAQHPALLTGLFVLGTLSALSGTLFKLMQHDIKRMLACSTMAQMGFMMMQCGLGLYAAAIAHLCWHGLFKASLFLGSGAAIAQSSPESNTLRPSFISLLAAVLGGFIAVCAFALITHKAMSWMQASAFVLFFAFIAGAQLMLTWVCHPKSRGSLVTGLVAAALAGLLYGVNVHGIELLLPRLMAIQTLSLSWLHWTIMILFGALWVGFNGGLPEKLNATRLGCWLYMTLFNASQPSAKTVTALRTDYSY
ncbi:oxidoreductase [Legionella taurinensis]|uniref:Oxidoreductase n=2 Tax=Legionella taurinensis TaxID=70611 RepID=A0AB38N804_9GAMM|nr:oxidoreductase [Legionella taurinensis]PUT44979.1 oxidoreductase [Legionella taurinensis]PUT48300.1 oxidoreductase [Legionella taurinensis]PUT49113.1 oxidoreductase [Legionella taurinensis]TID38040.1 oxidoreductase [Legionella taurinensis]